MNNPDTADPKVTPWQIAMFKRTLKKQLKLKALLKMLGSLQGEKCLLITCGDNNGALNYYFRAHGGQWRWADVSEENLAPISELLGEEVHHADPKRLPFNQDEFDWIVSIDVLEHLDNHKEFLSEIYRIAKTNGRLLVTVPNGDPRLLANKIKFKIGMSPETYGHTRAGYTLQELELATAEAGFSTLKKGGYSRFFTEMIELIINYSFVFMLSKKSGNQTQGHIAPSTAGELKTHGAAYRLYSLFYPILKIISGLDVILPAHTNNAVIIKANKPILPGDKT